jgi:hypothetical protein
MTVFEIKVLGSHTKRPNRFVTICNTEEEAIEEARKLFRNSDIVEIYCSRKRELK